jgi:hypothetical protein
MATITHNTNGTITISVTLDLPQGGLLEMEDAILDGVNEVDCLATAEALKRFDTNCSPIIKDKDLITTQHSIPGYSASSGCKP